MIKNSIFSSIPSIYEDEEVCNKLDCSLFKSIQPIGRPTAKTDNYDEYSKSYRKYIYEFIFGNETPINALKKIDDLTKIYYLSLNTDETSIGLYFFIIVLTLSFIMFSSLIFQFINRFKPYFTFLSTDFWFMIIIGMEILMFIYFSEFGPNSTKKCILKPFLLSLAYTLIIIPILYKLINNFPEENKITEWVNRHRLFFFFIFILFDSLYLILFYVPSYEIEMKKIEGKKIFEICKINSIITSIIYTLNTTIKILILLIILLLIYIEWNMESIYYDIRYLVPCIYTNILYFVILYVLKYIKINSYIYYFVVPEIFCIFTSLINYFLLYGIRVIWGIMKKENDETLFIKTVNKQFLVSQIIKTHENSDSKSDNTLEDLSTEYTENYAKNTNGKTQVNTNNTDYSINSQRTSTSSYLPQIFMKAYNYHNSK